ncbi:RICIN domain-containing protein [Nonomuraea sp. 3N208]|uniref:RICIN domain-containing protein n=1 Tax=Nonomuraea sp. 3N208 TaxID=3457421 RepID=UPI003FCCEF1F
MKTPAARPLQPGHRFRTAVTAIVVALVAVCHSLVASGPATAATIDTNASYVLVNRHSGKAMDVYNRSTADGANQQFRVADTDNGFVKLINRNSGKALEVWEWSTADGGRLSQGDILYYHWYAGDGSSRLGINKLGYDAAGWPFVY